MDDRLERNKGTAKEFYDLMFNECKPREAIEKHAGAMYKRHNPHVADEKEAFIAYFEKMAKEYPGKRVNFKRAFCGRKLCDFALPSGVANRQRPRLGGHRYFSLG